MPKMDRLLELFPGTSEELSSCVDWLNSTGHKLDALIRELRFYSIERSDAPDLANKAMQNSKDRAESILSRLQNFPETCFLSTDVTKPLSTAVFAMLAGLKKVASAESGASFIEAVDYFLAVSARYQHESKSAMKGCIAAKAILAREEDNATATGQHAATTGFLGGADVLAIQGEIEQSGAKGGVNDAVKPPGPKVSSEKKKNRRSVARRWDEFRRDYKTLGYTSGSYRNAAEWMVDKIEGMEFLTEGLSDPTDYDKIGKAIEKMVKAFRRTSTPKSTL